MNNLARMPIAANSGKVLQIGKMIYTPAQIDLIWRRAAKDCNPDEFNQFMHVCGSMQLDPMRKQIYALVYNKDKPDKRQMTIITGIDGYRLIARRTGNYRPDSRAPRFVIDPALIDQQSNPQGLVSAEVSVFTFSHGEWFEVPHLVEWNAYAPLVEDKNQYEYVETGEVWEDSGKPKKERRLKKDAERRWTLDPTKQRWHLDPKGMLAKCAEAGAIRKAFPDECSGAYTQDEMDKADILDLTATEAAESAAIANRLEKVHGKDTLLFDFIDERGLHPVAMGKVHDECEAALRKWADDPEAVDTWRDRNRHSLQQFWALAPNDALHIKKLCEEIMAKPKAADPAKQEEKP